MFAGSFKQLHWSLGLTLGSPSLSESSEDESDSFLVIIFSETIFDFLLTGISSSDSEEDDDEDEESLEMSFLTTFFGVMLFLLFMVVNFGLG